MSGGHLLTKQQAIQRILEQKYIPEDATVYGWTAYKNGSGEYLLLLSDADGNSFVARQGKELEAKGALEEPPAEIDGFKPVDSVEVVQDIDALGALRFGPASAAIAVQSLGEAAVTKGAYEYDAAADAVRSKETGDTFKPKGGTFTSESGEELAPGFMVNVGLGNYARFLGNDGYRRPMVSILFWNLAFAFFSVLFSFALGLIIAIAFEDLPGKRLIRSLLIIPYPIPVLVSIMVWRALLNERMGLVTGLLTNLFGFAPHFFTDVNWTRFAIVLINVYLSYPYFYILSSGALKSIPKDLYEAADIDGAGPLVTLRSITLPMLLRILGPLLIASFSFNFNNFTLVWGFNAGLPAMADTLVPMGHTDLLISFIYRLGFATANAADYGFSAAITVMLFVFVSLMVFFQTVNTRALKEAD
jgi:ABC-type sugar transport system permease subunit